MQLPRMDRLNCRLIRRVLLSCVLLLQFSLPAMAAMDEPAAQWIKVVLDSWGEACRTDLRIAVQPLPWMIFYDERHAWHINPDRKLLPSHTKLLPSHTRLPGSLRFAGRAYDVFEVAHDSKLWVPGREPIPVEPRAVTMLYDGDTRPFFIMGTPGFQKRALQVDETEDFRRFMVGLAMHELAHTRQLPQVVGQIKRLQKRHRYPESLDDNIIQTVFGKDSDFQAVYQQELKQFSAAVLASDAVGGREEAAEALRMLVRRRERFFAGEYEGWSEMEDVFLGLEGSAMWVQFQSALRMAPKGQPWLETLGVLAQRTDAWSQAEGLGMFLLIDRFTPGWQAVYFGKNVPSPVETLRQAVAAAAR